MNIFLCLFSELKQKVYKEMDAKNLKLIINSAKYDLYINKYQETDRLEGEFLRLVRSLKNTISTMIKQ